MRSVLSNIALVAMIVGGLQLCTALSPKFCPRCPANECGFFTPEDQRYLCPNGNILDECGCVSSCQCAGCPHVNMSLSCPHGREYDANNCPLNRCAPDPCICPANECGFGTPPDQRYTCPHGNVVDNCGCVTSCQCKDCPWVNIHLSCPHGRKTDANGCPLNECKPKQCICPANECGFFVTVDKRYICPNGNILDSCGCVSSCQCAGCPRVDTSLSCPGGRKTDANGCPLNQCEPDSCVCPANECGFGTPPDQRYTCPHGNVVDNCGCVTSCQCKNCPRVNIHLSCPHGRKTDSNDCPLNECKPEQCICPANECGFFVTADKRYTCPNGNVLDSCGCVSTCQCAGCPRINMDLSCPSGRKYASNGCPTDECQPALVVEKAGRCPQNGRPRNFLCTNDSSCPGTSKCCPYNGSRYCRPALRY